MLETMLHLFYAFIFVAGAARLAVIATRGKRSSRPVPRGRPSASGAGKIVDATMPVATHS